MLTIENSRSGNEMIVALAKYGYKKDVGPGVYDVHSPVVPRYQSGYSSPHYCLCSMSCLLAVAVV